MFLGVFSNVIGCVLHLPLVYRLHASHRALLRPLYDIVAPVGILQHGVFIISVLVLILPWFGFTAVCWLRAFRASALEIGCLLGGFVQQAPARGRFHPGQHLWAYFIVGGFTSCWDLYFYVLYIACMSCARASVVVGDDTEVSLATEY